MRVGDADRAETADLLASHYGAGRLDRAELDQRLGQAMEAKTRADLLALVADLPELQQKGLPDAADGRPRPPRLQPRARRRSLSPLPGVILILVLVLLFLHVPGLWVPIAVLACLWLLLRRRHQHP